MLACLTALRSAILAFIFRQRLLRASLAARYVAPPLCLAMVTLGLGHRSLHAEPLRVDAAIKADKKQYPLIDEARRKLGRMDVEGALESLKGAAKAHPELASPRVMLAAMFLANNRLREGRIQLEKAVVDTPDDPEPYLIMADLAFRDGQTTAAGLVYERALALANAFKGDNEKKIDYLKRAYMGVAFGAESHEQWEEARKYLMASLKLDATNAVGQYRLGLVLFELNKQKEAYAALRAASSLDEKIPSPEVTMAKMFEKAKDRENANKWMKQAVTTDPKSLKTRLEAGQWLLDTGRIAEAKQQVDEALKIDPDSSDAIFFAGVVARYGKDFPQALKQFEKAYLKSPGNATVANQLALTLVESGEEATRQRAVTLAEATMRQNTNSADAAATLGWIYFRLGRLDDAERLLSAATSTPTIAPDTAYYYAKLADARNRGDTAKQLLELALKSELPFAYRSEAQKLYDQLAKRPAAPAATAPAANP